MPTLTTSRCDKDPDSAQWEATVCDDDGTELFAFTAAHASQAIRKALIHANRLGVEVKTQTRYEGEAA